MKVRADNINGIFEVDCFEGIPMDYKTFKSALKQNGNDGILECELIESQISILDEEYGINQLVH